MRSTLTKFVIALFMVCSVSSAIAVGVVVTGTISYLDAREGGHLQIRFGNAVDFGQNCTLTDRATIDASVPNSSSMVAIAMQAYAMNQPIELYVDGCANINVDGTHTAARILRATLKR